MNKETKEQNQMANGGNGGRRRISRLQHIENWSELAYEANWKVGALAKNCGVSVRALQRHFRYSVGKSPKAWLLELRQKRAGEMVKAGNSSIKEIAGVLGYKHGHHLSREFKKHYGFSPTAVKQLQIVCRI